MRIHHQGANASGTLVSWCLGLLILLLPVCNAPAGTEVDPRLKEFAKLKRQQTEDVAKKFHLNVPPETREFFKVAEAGDWVAVSNQFAKIQPRVGQYEGSVLDPLFDNVLWIPLQETDSAYALFASWDKTLLQKFATDILRSMPDGSVYFGGTDPGRFAITLFHDVAKSPNILIMTQNALTDRRYMDYLRLIHGERLWLPTDPNIRAAFEQHANDLKPRDPGEQVSVDKNGHVIVRGVAGVMAVNGILTKMIFENNKAKHKFYVEESYAIPWMYPYMEPHGLILKLNREPLDKLDPGVMKHDQDFWDNLTRELLKDPKFLANNEARKMYSKLRSAIGGLYAYRHLASKAEAVYRQAMALYPAGPEASFRLAQLYMEQNRADDALMVMEQLQRLYPLDDKIASAVAQVREAKRMAEKKPSK